MLRSRAAIVGFAASVLVLAAAVVALAVTESGFGRDDPPPLVTDSSTSI